ncbi:efflux RND transporter periplasmic adaptor subunit [Methylobacterium sp. J-059]|uniref:efflux RND transporter periplasmic adaptor subunit n=1 Tax=Methylobacterium sp. J-059 TaxID=2836643 RepID=UPI001FBBD0C2|nr:efflux RND transporter periplasmic adaptor subunit [Methylobacterium sp. J-059]MCJ2038385.1 efflux RND transporter periplasmic adaptor subunit [Methylobacterium sp. J-059]
MIPSIKSRTRSGVLRTGLAAVAALLSATAAGAGGVTVDCVIEPAQKLKIGSATLGILKDVLVNRGDTVAEGQVVARLDTSVEEANVALSKAQAESSANVEAQRTRVDMYRRRNERQSQLGKGIVTQEKLDQVEADFEIGKRDLQTETLKHNLAEIELKRAQAQLDLRIIRSPISGLVTERLMSAGEFVRQDSGIYTLVQLDPLYVEAYVGVERWNELRIGSVGIVHLEKPLGGSYEARVTVVDHVFDAASGTFGIRLELPNPGNRLPGGQRCKLNLPTPFPEGPVAEALPPE